MPRYVAFLRAVNVGGRTVRMETLRERFESLGLSRVETFIASGNVIFETRFAKPQAVTAKPQAVTAKPEALETKIERELASFFGFEIATFLRTDAEVSAVASYPAFEEKRVAAAHALMIGFFRQPLAPAAFDKLRSREHDFAVHGRELYWLVQNRMAGSKITNAVLEKAAGFPGTFRNVNTVRKLAAKYPIS